ncbi:ATPase [Enterococcus sp. JM4C]|uniref:xylulokinase n=1 Tax=Candidatus Enterococcus huntleyi TaxID=1857217 RepID=UPI00137AEE56|nr:FGGY-family carbohydrate kinase [Enterococcus sp. JM4C]KAF1296235.1 ATPase [Enterococcus sp. JM4C]
MTDTAQIIEDIQLGKTALGIELGSTRIKAVLIDSTHSPIASGSFEWENQLVDGIWTYGLDEIWQGLQASYREMAAEVFSKYDTVLTKIGSLGISAMMHGYMAFDQADNLLVPFRTWRNAMTEQAEKELTDLFQFNIPQRWSIAHLYQAILNEEAHVSNISYLTTLAGYIHWQLTGEKVLGVGDASGMFPINAQGTDYDETRVEKFTQHISAKGFSWQLTDILPTVLAAGAEAGRLTEEGAKRLDLSGSLAAGTLVCPPEGDAGTGMVATNSVAKRTGNVSAGTSVFAMIVLEHQLKAVHPEIDLVTTPSGEAVAMVHANNCSSDINAWVKIFAEFMEAMGQTVDMNKLFETLFNEALKGDQDAGGLLSYGYYSGENITGLKEGRPLFVRTPDSKFTLANFMRTHLYSALGALKIGMDILSGEEQVQIDKIFGHGGLFKTEAVGQKVMAAAMNSPVSVMETAGEGGAWGIALLAAYALNQKDQQSLADYLTAEVFHGKTGIEIAPDEKDIAGFEEFIERYKNGLAIEQAAVDFLK